MPQSQQKHAIVHCCHCWAFHTNKGTSVAGNSPRAKKCTRNIRDRRKQFLLEGDENIRDFQRSNASNRAAPVAYSGSWVGEAIPKPQFYKSHSDSLSLRVSYKQCCRRATVRSTPGPPRKKSGIEKTADMNHRRVPSFSFHKLFHKTWQHTCKQQWNCHRSCQEDNLESPSR